MARIRLSSPVFAASILGCCLFIAASPFANAQAAEKPAKPAVGTKMSPSETYDKLLSGMEKEFVDLAEAMPADKYGFAPTQGEFKGARTFGEQVKHVAQANGYFFHDPSTPMVDDRAAMEKLQTKDDIIKALKDSFANAHKYISGITSENAFVMTSNGTRGGMAAFGIAHMMDHYGQMVEYARMNGIVPPASRGGNM